MALGDRLSCLNKNGLMLKLTSKAITKRKLKFYRKRRPENVFVSAKDEVPVGDVNTEKPLAATAEANAKIEHVMLNQKITPFFKTLLENCSTFQKIKMLERMSRQALSLVRNWKRLRFRIDSSKWSKIYLNPSVIDKTLILRLDEKGIIRAHWWLKDVRLLQQEMRNPVILPPDHLFVHLLVCHLHDMYGHCGYKNLIYEARRNYQIIESTTCLKVSPIYGSDPIFTSGSRFSTLFRHSHWYVRILAYKA